jgi:hypothetical protein
MQCVRGNFGVAVATALAIVLVGPVAWGHTFPPVRTVVVQVESCEVVLLVGYRLGSGEAAEKLVARGASLPKSQALEAMRDVMAAQAMAPLTVAIDGKPLSPTSVRAKLSPEGDGTRPMVVVLVSFPLPPGAELKISTKDPRTTRISWTDRDSHRVALEEAPAQGRWFTGPASFLLKLASPSGGPACRSSRPGSSSASSQQH